MSEKYFHVSRHPNDQYPTDVAFTPINSTPIPKKYLDFKSDIEAFVGTINHLYAREPAKKKDYLEQAYYAASLCFSGTDNDFATSVQTLVEIKSKVITTSWAKIRNKILTNYGLVVAFFAAGLFAISHFTSGALNNLPTVLAGTCIGSWVSMAIRTRDIQFDDISSSFNEFNSPILRACFVCALSLIITVLLLSGFLEINVGSLSSSTIASDTWVAFAVGILFGFGEKSLVSNLTEKSQGYLNP